MSHFVDTMAYVGEIPWHGLGSYLGEEDVTGKDMMNAAGLDWRVEKRPIYYADDGGSMEPVEDHFTMVRTDRGDSLHCVVGKKYEPFQNAELFQFGDELLGTGEVRWHTAGSLKEGRKIWGLAQLAGEQVVNRRSGVRDIHAPFLLLYNSHDGSSCLTARLTSVRVVCWNTLSWALTEKRPEFRVRHTDGMRERAQAAAELLGLAVEASGEQTVVLQSLADRAMSENEFTTFCAQLLTGKDDPNQALSTVAGAEGRFKTILERKGNELIHLFREGDGNSGADKKDAIDAVTQFIDRQKNRIGEWKKLDERMQGKRLDSQVFGQGEQTKRRAMRLLGA